MSSETGREYPNTTSQNWKSKSREVDYDEGLDIDLKDEMVGTGKAGPSKRGRAARSERRRRINEGLRKIQKLIPNCNKVDEVFILDEAIDYVKRLQHEVQILSQIPLAVDVSMEVPNSRPPTNANNMMEQEVVTSD